MKKLIRWAAREKMLDKWQKLWNNDSTGRWMFKLISQVRKWINRKYGKVQYHIIQALTGRGYFRPYLIRIKIMDTPRCNVDMMQSIHFLVARTGQCKQ